MFVIDITADNKVIETIRPQGRNNKTIQMIVWDRLFALKSSYNNLKAVRRFEFI
jgi:hypothetical protein